MADRSLDGLHLNRPVLLRQMRQGALRLTRRGDIRVSRLERFGKGEGHGLLQRRT